ncbi:MobP3 family relaxase [Pseudoflavonifractor capillosus]|uniref:Relaxase MobL n=1 Tax=Pseudoflavonifractor capillosus TaxID=106588 RepID=A0A921MNM2_9FIRM|nr:MobP3 family relaxase [Pseudoflavonifractor capillosus]HJG87161.1 relaxase MobL [Pseudoflavonifractor capillosus]
MSRVRFMSPYLKGGRDTGKLVNRARYIATRPGVEVLRGEHGDQPATKKQQAYIQRLLRDFPGAEELLEYEDYQASPTVEHADAFIRQVREDFAEPMSRMEHYLDYVSHRPGVQLDGEHGLWCAGGKVRNLSQAVREVAEHTGSVWTPVVAIRREDAERLGYNDAESWRQLVCACAPEIAKGYKIPLEQLRWYAAFHRKEESVHIHMVVFSSDPREGYLTKQGIRQVKSAFGRRIFQQDLIHVYEQKTEYRDTLGRDAERAMAELIAQMERGQLRNERLEQLVLELAERLHNAQGKKVYGYLPPGTKALVDAIVDELAKDARVAAAYDLWNQMREEVCRTYSEQLPERLPLSKQKEFKSVRNMVIREVLQLGQMEAPSSDAPQPISAPQNAPSSAPTEFHHGRPEPISSQQGQTHRAAAGADAARCVLQLFHSMGRIFQEQSAADTIQAGLHIDRKRRRMLREKRLALGHKADDHEDAVSITTQRR